MSNDQHPDEDIEFTSSWTGRLQIAGLILGILAWAAGATIAIGVTFEDPGRGQIGEVVYGVALVYGALPLTTLGTLLILSLAHFACDLEAPVATSLAVAPALLIPAASPLLQNSHVHTLSAALHIPGMLIVLYRLKKAKF